MKEAVPGLQLDQACEVLRACYERRWISTRDGNVSVHTGPAQTFWISPSGARKHRLTADDFVAVAAVAGVASPGQAAPSGELSLHRQLRALLPERQGTVLHVHATYAVAAMYAGLSLAEVCAAFPEVSRYSRVGPDVPALTATSEALAQATARAFRSGATGLPHIVGLDRHGVVAIGRDPWDAFEHVERLEHVCQMVLAGGGRPGRLARRSVSSVVGRPDATELELLA